MGRVASYARQSSIGYATLDEETNMVNNSVQYKIEKGIPPPKRVKGSKYRLGELAIGESVAFPKEARASVVSTWSRYRPKKFMSAIDEKDPTMVRIWRLK